MSVSPIKLDKQKYVVVKDKFVRYTLNAKARAPGPNQNWAQARRTYLYCYDYGNKLRVYSLKGGNKNDFIKIDNYVLITARKGRVNVLGIRVENDIRAIKNISNRITRLTTLVHCKRSDRRKPSFRFNKILVNFLKRNEIKFKFSKKDDWGTNLFKACYPSLRELDKIKADTHYSSIFTRQMRETKTMKELIKRTFGNSGKTINSQVYPYLEKRKNLDILKVGVLLKKLLPNEYIVKILSSKNLSTVMSCVDGEGVDCVRIFRKVLSRYPKERVVKLLTAGGIYCFKDTFRMLHSFPQLFEFLPEKPVSFIDIHDKIAEEMRKNNYDGSNFELALMKDKKLAAIDGQEIDGLKIVVPKTSVELREWGKLMHNCIGGYVNNVKHKNDLKLLGIEKDGKLVYNISVSDKIIQQFLGPCNSKPEEQDKNKITKLLEEHNIINPSVTIDEYFRSQNAEAVEEPNNEPVLV